MSNPCSTSCAGFWVEAWKKHHGQRRCGPRADGLQEEWNQVPMIFGELATRHRRVWPLSLHALVSPAGSALMASQILDTITSPTKKLAVTRKIPT